MTTLFVTRHPGAIDWARRQGIDATAVSHLDPNTVGPGDTVIGTLPVHIAAQVCANGARYMHLSLNTPPEWRGKELSAEDMERFGASLSRYLVLRKD